METVKTKIKDKRTGAITEVKASIADDFVGTGNFELVEDNKKEEKKPARDFNLEKNRE